MKASQIKEGRIYKNHDDKIAPRQITRIHSNGKKDKEVWFIDAFTLKSGCSTLSEMAEWATKELELEDLQAA